MFFGLRRMNAVYLSAVTLMMAACGPNTTSTEKLDTATEGTIRISVDETYKPLIDSEIKVFESPSFTHFLAFHPSCSPHVAGFFFFYYYSVITIIPNLMNPCGNLSRT